MIRKSTKALSTVFYVPNDASGQAFLKDLRRHLNRAIYKIRVRGRNPNRQQFRNERHPGKLRQHLPKRMSTYFAVYLDSPTNEQIRRTNEDKWQAQSMSHIRNLEAKIKELNQELDLVWRSRGIHYNARELEPFSFGKKRRISIRQG